MELERSRVDKEGRGSLRGRAQLPTVIPSLWTVPTPSLSEHPYEERSSRNVPLRHKPLSSRTISASLPRPPQTATEGQPMTPQNHDAWLQQITVACPTCGAAVEAPCVRPDTGAEIRGCHNARKIAAARSDGSGSK